MMHINTFPPEVLNKVFSYLTVKERFRYECVCRHWQNNVFTTIKTLSLEDCIGTSVANEENQDIVTLKCIISKCGQYLHSLEGVVSPAVMAAIDHHCNGLRCVKVEFYDRTTLDYFIDVYLSRRAKCDTQNIGENLTHVTVRGRLARKTDFLSKCPNLNSLKISGRWLMVVKELPVSLQNLQNLELTDDVNEKILETLSLLPKLTKLTIELRNDLHKSAAWKLLMNSWPNLKSLSLTVECEDSLPYEVLPKNLEHLELTILNFTELETGFAAFRTRLPKLKTLHVHQRAMTIAHLNQLVRSVAACFPVIQEFSIFFHPCDKREEIMDEHFEPLFSLNTLHKLAFGTTIKLTDGFLAVLVADLDQLTSLGAVGHDGYYSLLPDGEKFWHALKTKAASSPSKAYNLVGEPQNMLHLYETFSPNVSITLQGKCKVKISNGFCSSEQWRKLATQSALVHHLTIEIRDVNFNLRKLPSSLKTLFIICLNDVAIHDGDALTFDTHLPNLTRLRIFQENMSNHQLEATISCLSRHCPNLERLCLGRSNGVAEPVDHYIARLAKCLRIDHICRSETLVFSDAFKLFDGTMHRNNLGVGNMKCPCDYEDYKTYKDYEDHEVYEEW